MKQTPIHEHHNPDLLKVLPSVGRVVEVGCSSGALARAYKLLNPASRYIGIEIDTDYAYAAKMHCDEVIVGDIQSLLEATDCNQNLYGDCWVFGDTLEHIRDPWFVLRELRSRMDRKGYVCACIPNMQHWSIQLRLNLGMIQYEESGLLDRTHLRWFTRSTIIDLFHGSGYTVDLVQPRIFPHPNTNRAVSIIGWVADQQGGDKETAIKDAMPLQFVIRARPTN